MLTSTSPAPVAAVLDLYAASAPIKPLDFRCAVYQHARSDSVLWSIEGRPIAAAMFFPVGERAAELAFVCAPELKRHMVGFIHAANLTRHRMAEAGTHVRALVRVGHLPGRRLAALCGMRLAATAAGFERWEFDPYERIRPGREVAVHRA